MSKTMNITAEHSRYEQYRAIQQLDTGLEREYHLARKHFVSDAKRAERHIRRATIYEKEKTALNNLLTPKFPPLPLTLPSCDRETEKLAAEVEQHALMLKELRSQETQIREALHKLYELLRTVFNKDSIQTDKALQEIQYYERKLFHFNDEGMQIDRKTERISRVTAQRRKIWRETFCRGLPHRVAILTLLCAPRAMKLQRSSLHVLPNEIICALSTYLGPNTHTVSDIPPKPLFPLVV